MWRQIFVDINGNFFSGLWGHYFFDFLALLRLNVFFFLIRVPFFINNLGCEFMVFFFLGGGGNCIYIIEPTGNLMLLQYFEISYHWNVCVEVWNECDCIRLIKWKGRCMSISFIFVHSTVYIHYFFKSRFYGFHDCNTCIHIFQNKFYSDINVVKFYS